MSLRSAAAAKGIVYGGFPQLSAPDFLKNKKFQELFIQEYAMLVGGTFGVSTSFEPNQYDFYQVDPFQKFAEEKGLLFRGHPLIWGEYNAGWVNNAFRNSDRDRLNEILTREISAKASHYKGKIHSWDVVNEQVNPPDGRKDGLRKTGWLEKLGTGYIEQSFLLAKQADSNAKLVYNDFGLIYGNSSSYWSHRRTAVLKLLTKLKNNNAPIHALGIQSHIDAENYLRNGDEKELSKFLKEVSDLGLKIYITELDINDKGLPANHKERDRIAANIFYDYLSIALDNPAVDTIINWGLVDPISWAHKNSWYRRDDGDNRPLLFDKNYQPKKAYDAVIRALDEAKPRQERGNRTNPKKEAINLGSKSLVPRLEKAGLASDRLPRSEPSIESFLKWLEQKNTVDEEKVARLVKEFLNN